MKKIITYCLVFLILVSILLSACNNESSDVSSQTSQATSETTSTVPNDESSEPIDDSSEHEESVISIDETEVSTNNIPFQKNKYYDFENENISVLFSNKTHDYCICGYECYTSSEYYDAALEYPFSELFDIIPTDGFWKDYMMGKTDEELGYLPYIYIIIREFDISRDEFVEAYEKFKQRNAGIEPEYRQYYQYLTDKQIEILTGDYSEETIKRELKCKTTFYFEGALYCSTDLSNSNAVDDETLKRMMADESFYLYLFDIKAIIDTGGILERIESLSATE